MIFKQITIAIALSAAISSPAFAHSDGDGHCKDTQLGSIMKEMSDDLKTYVGAFKRGDQAAMQTQLTKLLANSTKAKDEVPLKLQQDMPTMKGMDHSNMANMQNMKDMDHSNMANMQNMKGMDHSNMANMQNMKGMDHSNMANMQDMKDMDHSNMANMEGMDHSTHMQHMDYQQGIDKLTHLFNQLQDATTKGEVKTALGNIKQHIKKSHKAFRLNCD
ncbi:MAG: copper resistance protein CopA [Moritella sp.]|uniref:copper resistance protein CopA n=1 Tax=Moritella sp. TaxID=78556 RepID=UPI00216D644B|nr:copper resistance protein CopA [Moritella sp.]MBL1418191.1 copper resistance protein CopA [Moritella sp.]